MDELEQQPELNTESKPTTTQEPTSETKVGSVFNFEDMIRSERQVNSYATSVTSTEAVVKPAEDRIFSKKVDEKKKYYKKRVKIATGVYTTIVTLLLILTGANIFSLVSMSKDITTNTKTMQANSERIVALEEQVSNATTGEGEILVTLNQPRDYSKEKTELTFLDKVTILIKNLFG